MTARRSKSCYRFTRLLAACGFVPAIASPGYAQTGARRNVILPTVIKTPAGGLSYSLAVGPLGPVTAVAFSPDGARLAAGGYRSVTLWDLKTGRPSGFVHGLSGQVQSVAFHPGGEFLAVAGGEAGKSAQAAVYNVADPTRKTLLLGHTEVVNHIAWSVDGKSIVTAAQDKTARLWSWPGGLVRMVFRGHADAVTRALLSPDGRVAYTACLDRNVRRFDATSGQAVKTFTAAGDSISALAFSSDGRQLVSSGPEARIRWWNPDTGETSRYSYGTGEVNDLCFSKDGKKLASASADRAVRLWNVENAGQIRTLGGAGDWIFSVGMSPDGKIVAGGGGEGIIRLWEVETGRLRMLLMTGPQMEWLAFTPEGYYAGSTAWTAGIRAWSAGKPVPDLNLAELIRALRRPDMVESALKLAEVKTPDLPARPPAAKKG